MISALKSGIIVLMVPPFFICLLITNLSYKKRNQFRSSRLSGAAGSSAIESENADLGW